MEIEFFLENINQEVIRSQEAKTQPRKHVGGKTIPIENVKGLCNGCIYASWTKSCCILDFGYRLHDKGDLDPLPPYWLMRPEYEGGLLWDPTTAHVFRLDDEGYEVLCRMESGLSESSIARDMGRPVEDIKRFKKRVQDATARPADGV